MNVNIANLDKNLEHWASIDGYLNYDVSWWGRVRNATTARILKGSLNAGGYFVVGLVNNRKIENTLHPPARCTRVGGQP